MMRVTVIDKPRSEERVMVTHEGKQACCYVQGNAWDAPSCEDTFQEWSRTPGVNPQVWIDQATNVISDSSLPWHQALAISRIVLKKYREFDNLTPEDSGSPTACSSSGPGIRHAPGRTATS